MSILDAAPSAGVRALFEAEGSLREAGADRSFLLRGDTAWLVAAGRIDVFSVRVVGGEPAGERRHLVRVEEGGPLLGISSIDGDAGGGDGMGLLAVGAAGTRLLALPQARLRAMAAVDPAIPGAVLAAWAGSLCAGVARGLVPKRCDDLEEGAAPELAPGASLRPRGVAWIRHAEGSSLLLGRDGLRLNGDVAVPVAAPAWITADGPGRLEPAASTPPPGDGAWRGVERLYALVLALSAELAAQSEAEERERLRRRAALGRSTLERACARLAGVLDTGSPVKGPAMRLRAAADGGEAALFAACRLVGGALGISVRPPASGAAAGLAEIARASRFRTRRVVLREGWWKRDGGPLLALSDPERRPLALLPVASRRYVLCDPEARTRVPVDEGVAATLAPFAYAFYRPFVPEPLGVRGVLRFAVRGSGRDLATVLAMGAAGGALGMAVPLATGTLFNSVIPGAERGQLVQLMAVLLAAAVAAGLFQLTRAIALTRIEGKMGAAVQAAVWDRLLSLPVTFFRSSAAGDLAVRAMGIDSIRQILSGATVTAMIGLIFALFNFALLFHFSVRLALWATLLSGVALAVTMGVSWAQLRHQRTLAKLQAEISGLVLQLLTGIAKLRVAGAEAQAFGLWAEQFARQRKLRYAVRRIGSGHAAFNAAFPAAAYLVIFAAAAPLAAGDPPLRTGDFLGFLTAFAAFTAALLSTSGAAFSVLTAIPYYENARPILQSTPESSEGKADPGPLTGDIAVQHVSFRYQADQPYVLRDFSLQVRAGEFVALVGPSGSGKSTLLRLLLGFEAPESGSVYFDGQELAGLDAPAVRRQIGVVLQNGRLMPGDIFTNIVGSAGASLDDAWEAARMAGLEADVRAMPMGMHTVVSEGGTTLSGGQRQRLMIARAVVTRPRILLFDEATSALDNRTQAIVSESLAHLRATRVVIAHRLSTVVHADRIFVVERGEVVQRGSYHELMAVEGPFRELARRQLV